MFLTCSFEGTAKLIRRHFPRAICVVGQEEHLQQEKFTFNNLNQTRTNQHDQRQLVDLQQ